VSALSILFIHICSFERKILKHEVLQSTLISLINNYSFNIKNIIETLYYLQVFKFIILLIFIVIWEFALP